MNLEIAAELCRRFEGFRASPYLCPAGIPTIGYGSTYYPGGRPVRMSDAAISQKTAGEYLMHELEHTYAPGVLRLCPNLIQHPPAFNAAVDFAYNLGVGRLQSSTLRRKLVAEDWEGAKAELAKWVRGGGKILPGLVRRRAEEARLL